MSDIFISYAREDEARIQKLVRALEQRGLSVFWDRNIPAGQTWRSHIGKALSDLQHSSSSSLHVISPNRMDLVTFAQLRKSATVTSMEKPSR